jgi:hypothetical protein
MRFMNEYDIQETHHEYVDHPVLGPATETLRNLAQWADENSDGWAYWPKPARSAVKLMELIEGDGTWQAKEDAWVRATPVAYKKALAPIKTFRTRQGADFRIIDL